MIVTRLLHRSTPRIAATALKPHLVGKASATAALDGSLRPAPTHPRKTLPTIDYTRSFSTSIQGTVSDGKSSSHEKIQKTPGSVTRTLRVLDMDVVKNILNELRSVDTNSDGR